MPANSILPRFKDWRYIDDDTRKTPRAYSVRVFADATRADDAVRAFRLQGFKARSYSRTVKADRLDITVYVVTARHR